MYRNVQMQNGVQNSKLVANYRCDEKVLIKCGLVIAYKVLYQTSLTQIYSNLLLKLKTKKFKTIDVYMQGKFFAFIQCSTLDWA